MARNGSGTYNLPAGNPVTTGTTISSTWANSTLSDMATALTGSVASDGQTTPSANLPMGTFAHTNVGNATVRTMYASAGQVQDGGLTYLTSVSGADTITAVGAVGMTAYATGQKFTFIAAGANTGAATININSLGAKAITKNGATALAAGDIASGVAVEVFYDGTQFQLLNSSVASVSSFSAGTTGLTPSTSTAGAVTLAGTLAAANGGTGLTSPGTSGNILTSNGTAWISAASASYAGLSTVIFTSSGTWTVPAGITQARVTVIGGGGGGGGYSGAAGGFGGIGGLAIALVTGLSGTITITVGTGGAGSYTTTGSAGSTSSFGSAVSATGGAGGAAGGSYVNAISGAGTISSGTTLRANPSSVSSSIYSIPSLVNGNGRPPGTSLSSPIAYSISAEWGAGSVGYPETGTSSNDATGGINGVVMIEY